MPIAANKVIVVGSATTWPIACSFWLRPNRVKSGMLSDSVDQNAIVAVSDEIVTPQNGCVPVYDVCCTIGPTPPALSIAHHTSSAVITSTYGAAQRSTRRSNSMPRKITSTLSPQKVANAIHCEFWNGNSSPLPPWFHAGCDAPSRSAQPGHSDVKNVCSAPPPIHALIPNQPHATSARISAGRFDPEVP